MCCVMLLSIYFPTVDRLACIPVSYDTGQKAQPCVVHACEAASLVRLHWLPRLPPCSCPTLAESAESAVKQPAKFNVVATSNRC